jgi:hypothetical protein
MSAMLIHALLALILAAVDQGAMNAAAMDRWTPAREAAAPAPVPVTPVPVTPVLDLEALFDQPRPWLGREVRFTFQLAELPEQWNPFMTRFGTRDHVAARVWGDGQLLWREDEFASPLGLVFASRGSAAASVLAEAGRYQRFTARARVVEVFAGDPWAELIELVPESRAVVEGSILHAGRALRLMAAGDWQLAREDLVRASAAALPDHAREELHRLLARCDAAIAERAARRVPLEPVR